MGIKIRVWAQIRKRRWKVGRVAEKDGGGKIDRDPIKLIVIFLLKVWRFLMAIFHSSPMSTYMNLIHFYSDGGKPFNLILSDYRKILNQYFLSILDDKLLQSFWGRDDLRCNFLSIRLTEITSQWILLIKKASASICHIARGFYTRNDVFIQLGVLSPVLNTVVFLIPEYPRNKNQWDPERQKNQGWINNLTVEKSSIKLECFTL